MVSAPRVGGNSAWPDGPAPLTRASSANGNGHVRPVTNGSDAYRRTYEPPAQHLAAGRDGTGVQRGVGGDGAGQALHRGGQPEQLLDGRRQPGRGVEQGAALARSASGTPR